MFAPQTERIKAVRGRDCAENQYTTDLVRVARSISSTRAFCSSVSRIYRRLLLISCCLFNGWEPPTPEHQGLKKFMLQQLGISKGSTEYSKKGLAAALAASPGKYYSQAVLSAEDSIQYHTENLQKEVKRAEGNTDWIKQLRASLAVAR